MRGLCVFEDGGHTGLLPLAYSRASYELRLGMYTLLERSLRYYPNTTISLFARESLTDVLKERYPYYINTLDPEADGYLFINGRTLNPEPIPLEGEDEIGVFKDTLVYARLSKKNYQDVSPDSFASTELLKKLKKKSSKVREVEVRLIDYSWDIMKSNREELEKDFSILHEKGQILGKVYEGVHILNPKWVFLGKGARVKPGCVLDAEESPIYVGEDVTIMPNATIIGPAFIDKGTVVLPAARLREGSNIGVGCKVGGEISNSILHSYSSKQHDGFLGDSYIGSWVNLGAGTTTSNLKNTYGSIKAKLTRNKKLVDTKEVFLGAAIGDHTKVGINTSFDAGSLIGCHSSIAGRKPVPKFLPSFSWLTDQGLKVYNMRKAFIAATRAMARRNVHMSAAEEAMFRNIFAVTTLERKGMRK
ncbi:MAG: putative sugar nucleotidyl transferase [Candidatus Brocadiales bacterium]